MCRNLVSHLIASRDAEWPSPGLPRSIPGPSLTPAYRGTLMEGRCKAPDSLCARRYPKATHSPIRSKTQAPSPAANNDSPSLQSRRVLPCVSAPRRRLPSASGTFLSYVPEQSYTVQNARQLGSLVSLSRATAAYTTSRGGGRGRCTRQIMVYDLIKTILCRSVGCHVSEQTQSSYASSWPRGAHSPTQRR